MFKHILTAAALTACTAAANAQQNNFENLPEFLTECTVDADIWYNDKMKYIKAAMKYPDYTPNLNRLNKMKREMIGGCVAAKHQQQLEKLQAETEAAKDGQPKL